MIPAICACLSTLFAAAPQEENDPLVVNVLADGTIKIDGRVFFKPNPLKPSEQDTKKFAELFEVRRQLEKYQAVKGNANFANYPVLVRADRSTPFQYIQLVLMAAATHGGVTKIQFGKLRDDEKEGKLDCQLPTDKTRPPPAFNPSNEEIEVPEVRILLCVADASEKDREQHRLNKGRHEATLESEEQADLGRTAGENPVHLILNDVCVASVGKTAIGSLYKSWICKEEKHREETKLDAEKRGAENRALYMAIAIQARKQYDLIPADKKAPVILDADSAVPYEHILGVVGACKEAGIENVEFTVNSRWVPDDGPFRTYRDKKK